MDGIGVFVSIYRYHRGQGCEYICDNNGFEELIAISLTPEYPGGAEVFFDKWNSVVVNLEEINGRSGNINTTEWL